MLEAFYGAAGSFAGPVVSGLFGKSESSSARKFALMMAQNKHQFEVADLRKAGLNPILSANSGATVGMPPIASMPPASNPATAYMEMRAAKSVIEKNKADAAAAMQSVEESKSRQNLTDAQANVASAQGVMANIEAQRTQSSAMVDQSGVGAELADVISSLPPKLQGIARSVAGLANRAPEPYKDAAANSAASFNNMIQGPQGRHPAANIIVNSAKMLKEKVLDKLYKSESIRKVWDRAFTVPMPRRKNESDSEYLRRSIRNTAQKVVDEYNRKQKSL